MQNVNPIQPIRAFKLECRTCWAMISVGIRRPQHGKSIRWPHKAPQVYLELIELVQLLGRPPASVMCLPFQ